MEINIMLVWLKDKRIGKHWLCLSNKFQHDLQILMSVRNPRNIMRPTSESIAEFALFTHCGYCNIVQFQKYAKIETIQQFDWYISFQAIIYRRRLLRRVPTFKTRFVNNETTIKITSIKRFEKKMIFCEKKFACVKHLELNGFYEGYTTK